MTIRVSDQGGGIPRRMTDTLFEYLYTTAPTPAITSSVDLPGKVVRILKKRAQDMSRSGKVSRTFEFVRVFGVAEKVQAKV